MPLLVSDDRRSGWSVATSATILSDTLSPLQLAHASRWQLIVTTTTNALSALRVRYRNRAEGAWGPWESITTGLPLSAGSSLRIVDTDSAALELDVEATASGGAASVALDLVGR
jgi:hypothetical protein